MNTLITDEQVAEAQEAAARAALDLQAIQRNAPVGGDYAAWGQRLEDAHRKARTTVTRATGIAEAQTQQRDALAARASAEQQAGKSLDAMAARLAASRDGTVKTIAAAEKAMAAMVAAVDAHDRLVRESAAELHTTGLTVADAAGEYDTGGTPRSGLVLRGEWWLPIDTATALVRSVHGVVRTVLGAQHPLASRLKYTFGLQQMEKQRGGVIEHVPELKASALPRPARMAVRSAPIEGAPVMGVDPDRWRRGDR